MAYRVEFTDAARRQLISLEADARQRIAVSIRALADNPRPFGCVKLEGKETGYRIRVGDDRVVYHIDDSALRVTVVKIAHRREVYR